MRILLAAPDRDLLECCQTIIEADCGETVTAFDGTQVLSLTAAESFDVVVLDCAIPRIDYKTLMERIQSKGVPVVLLINEPVSTRQLLAAPLANACLSYPFEPAQITAVIGDTVQKAASGEWFSVGKTEIDVGGFCITNGPRLTAGEIDTLRSLLRGEGVTTERGAYISALNQKIAAIGAKERIKYKAGKGFELVTHDE